MIKLKLLLEQLAHGSQWHAFKAGSMNDISGGMENNTGLA
jgi:hypothetical protein